MNTVDAAMHIKAIIERAFIEISFTPPPPPKRAPRVKKVETDLDRSDPVLRDNSSSWTMFIEYVDADGVASERRITALRFEHRIGGFPALAALCHERRDHRLFRLDRIRQIVDITTGEILDPPIYLDKLQRTGLPRVNRGMYSFCRVLAFIARCDGNFHQLEHDAIETALTSYALRFDGETEDVANTLAAIKNMTPDCVDLNNAMVAILRSPASVRQSVAGLLLKCVAEVIDADGKHMIEEIGWAMALRDCLETIRR